jgi:uncharacterized protein YlxW (UPF0749 family)
MYPSRVLCLIAGVDYETLLKCPRTDRLWAAHLGFSLILSFLVVSAITYNATSYVVASPAMRVAVSVIVALTVFMFDRALYQADWFLQPSLEHSEWNAARALRIALRLGISLCLSFALAMFLELAIFADTITEKLQEDFRRANAALFQKAKDFETSLEEQLVGSKEALAQAEDSLMAIERGELPATVRLNEMQETLLRVTQQISLFEEDKNAELFGQKTRSGQTGIAGRGPAYQFAEAQIQGLGSRVDQLENSIADLRGEETRARNSAEGRVKDLRAEVADLVAARPGSAASFRQDVVEGSPEFQKQRNDPLARMEAYAELKRDPERGTAIVLFSWLVLLFVSFLEVVPVAAKMLFCPPSVYGSIIKAQTQRERRDAEARSAIQAAPATIEVAAPDSGQLRYIRMAEASYKKREIPEVIIRKRDLDDGVAPIVG